MTQLSTDSDVMGRVTVKVASLLAVGLAGFQLYTAWVPPLPLFIQRGVHVTFVLALIFLLYRSRTPLGRLLDIILTLAGIGVCLYVLLNYPAFRLQRGIYLDHEVVLGTLMLLVVLEAGRRTAGLALPLLGVVAVLYAVFGHLLPPPWQHPRFSYARVVTYLYTSEEGIWSFVTGVSAGMLSAFVIFGAFLSRSGIERVFTEFAQAIGGRVRGGPAQVAVVSSALFGMVSGSSTANVLTTGAFTIPLMKKVGYSPTFAAAVEAVASNGGQLIPPVMGIAAFIMVEVIGVPYLAIVKAAFIPGLLYMVAVSISVYLQARATNLDTTQADEELPVLRQVLRERWYQLIPIIVLAAGIIRGISISMAALFAVMATVIFSWASRKERMGPRALWQALELGGRNIVAVAASIVCAGIVLGVIQMTGLGLKVTSIVIRLSGGDLFTALLLTMVAAIILGMGLPTVAAYVVAATAAGPGLVFLGVDKLVAHLFIFYFAILGSITPPVCISVYAAASLANTRWLPVAIQSMKMALPSLLVAFMFVYHPALLMQGTFGAIAMASVSALVGVACLTAGFLGFLFHPLSWWQRALLAGIAVLLIEGNLLTDLLGGVLLLLVLITHVGIKNVGRLRDKIGSSESGPNS